VQTEQCFLRYNDVSGEYTDLGGVALLKNTTLWQDKIIRPIGAMVKKYGEIHKLTIPSNKIAYSSPQSS
jgi:hypothetical protein